jgi:hypothetical protein
MAGACPLATLGTLKELSPVDAALPKRASELTSRGGLDPLRRGPSRMWDPEIGGNETEHEDTVTQIETDTVRSRPFLICEPSQLHAGKRGWR